MISKLPRRKAPLTFYIFTVISTAPEGREQVVRAKCRSDEIAMSQGRMLARNVSQTWGVAEVEVSWLDSTGIVNRVRTTAA
jgi:hypothetical protein